MAMDLLRSQIPSFVSSLKETRLSGLKSPTEFFDFTKVSRPADLNTATSRITHNTRYFSSNYAVIIAILAVYALLTNVMLIWAIMFLVGGFAAINKFAPEPLEVGDHVITQRGLYTGLFCIGIPLLFFASPIGTFFWLVGASSILILGHACMLEPGVETAYAEVSQV